MQIQNKELEKRKQFFEEKSKKLASDIRPKAKDCLRHQQEILAELKRIKEDSELLPSMFRNQAGEQSNLIEEKNEANKMMKEF